MIRATISGDPNFELSTVDIDRPGPHYAVDTVQYPYGTTTWHGLDLYHGRRQLEGFTDLAFSA